MVDAMPRSAMSSCKSRRLKQKRRYQRTQVTITSGSNFRFQNKGGRHDFMVYRTRSAAATLPTIALMRKVRHRGIEKVGWVFTFAAAAYNLVRMRNLLAQPVGAA